MPFPWGLSTGLKNKANVGKQFLVHGNETRAERAEYRKKMGKLKELARLLGVPWRSSRI